MGNNRPSKEAGCAFPYLTRMCCAPRCKAPKDAPYECAMADDIIRTAAIPLGCTVAAGVSLGAWAKAGGLPPIVRAGIAGAALCIPVTVALKAATPVMKRKLDEATEQDKQPRPDGTVPSGWYNCGVVVQVFSWAADDWPLWGTTYGIIILQAAASSTLPAAASSALKAISNPESSMSKALWVLSGTLVASASLNALKGVVTQEAQTRLVVRIQQQALTHVMRQETLFFDSNTTTAIFTELSHVGSLRAVMSDLIPAILGTGVRLASTALMLAKYDVTLAAICLLSVPADYILSQWHTITLARYSEEAQAMMAECRHLAQEMVQGVKTAKTHNAVDEQMDGFWASNQSLLALLRERSMQLALASLVNTAVPHLTSLIIFGYAGHLAQYGRLDTSHLVTVALHQASLMSAFQSLAMTYGKYGILMGQCRKGLRFLSRQPQHEARGTYRPEAPWKGGVIQLQNVSFRYRPEKDFVLHNFCLRVNPGECVALVGPSGGGKTTVLNLILALYDPTEGEVRISGVPVAEYDPLWYYGQGVAAVPQCPILLQGTIRDNIAFGLGDVLSLEEIKAAAEQANAAEFIAELPGGYDAEVGKGGERLSGGQRQRLAVARALVRCPGILLLDEATSALDAEAEHHVQEAIHSAMKGRTVLVVAHRLSTIRKADRIVVVDQGRVVEEGDYATLLANKGPFSSLVRNQLFLDN